MKKKKRNMNKRMTEEQKKELQRKRTERAFRRKIRNTFIDMGFTYFATANKNFKIGFRIVELDYVFIYENIILICEDTCGKRKDKDHIRKKSEAFKEIATNMPTLIEWLKKNFPDKIEQINKYRVERYFAYYIYISQAELNLTNDEKNIFSNLIFWEPETLSYFSKMSQTIHYSARYDIFRFLKINDEQLGYSGSEGSKTVITAPIIYPEDTTGIEKNVRIISFMMSAEKLIHTSYVLRKDSWEDSIYLYQRLIEKERIKNVREFIAKKGTAFLNNIIVSLPNDVKFEDDAGNVHSIEEIGDYQHCKLILPSEMNSICVIDGQHRIYAHYEAPDTDKYESLIAPLRKQLHLLVTGLIFPKEMKEAERKQMQSEIFLDINDNTKKVAANVLTHIEMIKDPFSDIGLARRIIERLNKENTFLNKFELSSLDGNKIKVASIIKFALRYLVTVTPTEGRESLFKYWEGDKDGFQNKDEEALNAYIFFCAKRIDMYFSAVKAVFRDAWDDPESRMLSVIVINGFIMAFNRQLNKYGIREYEFYWDKMQNLDIDFSKERFPYTSSRYKLFSNQILTQAFGFTKEELENS